MASTNGYPSGAVSTSYTAPAATTDTLAMDSLEYYNQQEMDITGVSPDGTAISKIMTTLMVLGKTLSGGEFDDAGLQEMMTVNFPEYKFLEQDLMNRVYSLNAVANGVITTLVLASGNTNALQRGDLLRLTATSEIVRIASITNLTTFEVVRGVSTFNAQAGQAIGAAAVAVLIGNSMSAGEAGRNPISTAAVERSNFIQKIATPFKVTDADVFSGKYGSDKKVAMQQFIKNHFLEHVKQIELIALLGQKATGTDATTGEKWWNTEGLLNTLLRGFAGDISGSLTIETISNEFGKTLLYGGNTKIVFCGTSVLAKIRSLFTGFINVSTIDSVNLRISTLELNGGTFILTTHPYMTSDNGLDKIAIVCDPTMFKPVYPTGVDGDGVKKIGKSTMYKVDNKSNYAVKWAEWVIYL